MEKGVSSWIQRCGYHWYEIQKEFGTYVFEPIMDARSNFVLICGESK